MITRELKTQTSEQLGRTRLPFELKASDDTKRTVTGLAAAWSMDAGDDVIRKGAFVRTLDHWRAGKKSRPIHLKDMHRRSSVLDIVGKMTDAEETEDGLVTTFEFIPEDPAADAAYRRVKGGYVTGLSIGYSPVRYEYQQKEGGESWQRIRILHEVKLFEVSLVDDPMNDEARIDDVKSLTEALKAGRLTDQQKQELRALLDAPPVGQTAPPSPAPVVPGLAPDAPKRLAIEEQLRDIHLRSLATR